MTGYLSPPTVIPPLRITTNGGSPLDLKAGAVDIAAGFTTSVQADTTARRVTLNATTPQPSQDLFAFAPGSLSARTLGKYLNQRPGGSVATVELLEVNLQTAPGTGVDASNYYGLSVSGAVSGAVTLPLNTQGQNLFRLDDCTPTDVAYVNTTSGSFQKAFWGIMTKFTPTADFLCYAIGVYGLVSKGQYAITSGILDAGRNWLSSTTQNITTEQENTVYLPAPVQLKQGVSYWIGQQISGGYPSNDGPLNDGTYNTEINGGTNANSTLSAAYQDGIVFGGKVTAGIGIDAVSNPNLVAASVHSQGSGFTGLSVCAVKGKPTGVTLSGEITAALTLTGVAPTVPGADALVRIGIRGSI